MKVINVIPAISNEASGPSYSVLKLCTFLNKMDIDVKLVALDWVNKINNLSFVHLFKISIGPKKLGRSISMYQWINEQVKVEKKYLIHNHGMWQMNSVYPGRLSSKYNIPYIVSPRGAFSVWAMKHGSIFKSIFWNFLQKPSFKNVACFHATALSEYYDIRRLGFKQPVAIIPNGIDIPNYFKKNDKNSRTVLFLGRIHEVKGIDLLLRAWMKLYPLFPDWNLKIVGGDSGFHSSSGYLNKMKALSHDLKLKRVEFVGPKFGSDKWSEYANADIYVLPTYSENFAITVAEALASGTPCIVTKGAPWAELEKYDAGKWIDIGENPLTIALTELMNKDILELRQMGLNGRNWVEKDFSWLKVAQEMKDVYEWILGNNVNCPSCVKLD
jgi:glycosyltransferase involved in cell wall biosynthesis